MLRTIFGRVMWLARGTSMILGLAVMLALVLGLSTVALAAVPGDPFKLGKSNTINKISSLVGSASTALLKIDNNGTGPALDLQVEPGVDPLKVNSGEEVDNLRAASATKADDSGKLDGMEPSQLPGSIASTSTIYSFPGLPFDLGTSSGGFKFVGDPATGITTTSSQRLVGAAAVPLGDPTATSFSYNLCYRPSGGSTITPFNGGSTGTLWPNDVSWTATSSVVPGAGTWDVGFCIRSAVNDARNAERTSYVNGWVQVVNE